MNMTLFEDTFTGINGRTHYVVTGCASRAEVLNSFRGTTSSPVGERFLKIAPRIRELMSKLLIYMVKIWEAK